MIVAKRSLQAHLGSDAADWATDQLSKGLDSPYLRQLAGFTGQENPFELEDAIDRTLGELGINTLSPGAAVELYAWELAREFKAGASSRELFLRELCHLYINTDYPRALMPFYHLRWTLDDIKEQGWSFYCHEATSENFDELLKQEIAILLGKSPASS